jgi:hypothetical protein
MGVEPTDDDRMVEPTQHGDLTLQAAQGGLIVDQVGADKLDHHCDQPTVVERLIGLVGATST